jgi:iron complex transport system ATP-binding protein
MDQMIRIHDLTVAYGKYLALKNVSLDIKTGIVTCILGPNGAGKSTLLIAISKIVPYQGKIIIDGYEVSREPLKTISRMVSYASDITVNDLLSLTVREALVIARYPVSSGFFESEHDYRVVEATARELYIDHLLDRKLSQLSSGELQRVVIALALVKNPKVLLFDELDAHIDLGLKYILSKKLNIWARDRVLVFTTHDILYGTSIGEYFIVLSKGSVVLVGGIEELVEKRGLLEKIYGVRLTSVNIGGRIILVPVYI